MQQKSNITLRKSTNENKNNVITEEEPHDEPDEVQIHTNNDSSIGMQSTYRSNSIVHFQSTKESPMKEEDGLRSNKNTSKLLGKQIL